MPLLFVFVLGVGSGVYVSSSTKSMLGLAALGAGAIYMYKVAK